MRFATCSGSAFNPFTEIGENGVTRMPVLARLSYDGICDFR